MNKALLMTSNTNLRVRLKERQDQINDLTEQNKILQKHIDGYKFLGTDACPDCNNEYPYHENRVAIYYHEKEHEHHETKEEKLKEGAISSYKGDQK